MAYYLKPKRLNIDHLNWLANEWQRIDLPEGQSAFEKWEINHGVYEGIGVSLYGNDTTFIEHLKIVKIEQDFFYVAEVNHNEEPSFFKIQSMDKNGFICTNPKHDFPKQINYRLNGDTLRVLISGDGRSIPFTFIRMK